MKLWRGQPDNWSWKPSAKERSLFWFGLGGVCLSAAMNSFLHPGHPPFIGREARLHQLFFQMFGPNGDVILYASIGVVCMVAGFSAYPEKKKRIMKLLESLQSWYR
jgi:hypothetical protein